MSGTGDEAPDGIRRVQNHRNPENLHIKVLGFYTDISDGLIKIMKLLVLTIDNGK